MQAPRAASEVGTLNQWWPPASRSFLWKSGVQGRESHGSPNYLPTTSSPRRAGLGAQRDVTSRLARRGAFARNRSLGASRAALSSCWCKGQPVPEAAILGRRCCLNPLGLPSPSPRPPAPAISAPPFAQEGQQPLDPTHICWRTVPPPGKPDSLPPCPTLTFCHYVPNTGEEGLLWPPGLSLPL